MNKLSGKVIVKEMGIGIPNLLIVIYDVDPNTQAEEVFSPHHHAQPNAVDFNFWQRFHGDRLGSVLTDQNGEFELFYEDTEFQIRNQEKRPDLVLFVMAPEDTDGEIQGIPTSSPPSRQILHFSYASRANAGRTESYIIRLRATQLEKAGIPYPSSSAHGAGDQGTLIAALDRSFIVADTIQGKLDARTSQQMIKASEAADRAAKAFEKFSPSSVPSAIRADATYFAPGDDLRRAQTTLIRRALSRLGQSKAKRSLRLNVTQEDLTAWGLTAAEDGTIRGTVELGRVLERIEKRLVATDFNRVRSPLAICRDEMKAEMICEDITGPNHHEETPPPVAAEAEAEHLDADLATDDLVREKIALHMEHVTSPETHLKYSVPERAEQSDVMNAIHTFNLTGGPADVTSYHDFYDLEIAFEHVWTELFDGEVAGLGRRIFEAWVRYKHRVSGVEDAGAVGDEPAIVETLEDLEGLVGNIDSFIARLASVNPPPADVKHLVPEITSEEWNTLEVSDQEALVDLAYSAFHRHRPGTVIVVNVDTPATKDPWIEEKRQQSRDILARAEENPDEPGKLPNLLEELRKRLAQPHKFDIFAPNSVNYGLLVNYRQEWRPLNFQVGDLVTTIPLAPKEVRKYTKKRVVKKSRLQKEIEDALRIRKEEAANTARVDAEIVRKATTKTNFKAAAEAEGGFGNFFRASASTALEKDVEKSSAQTKKDFRESALKAAEEYKQEHRLEVETATTEEFEETAAIEISNPNDEIPVTYLFYELQRRYEISEKIHRLTSVILVANDVPAPHEIDEDWLVAHDWILRRVILDDSYRPALDFLLESSIGEAFSLKVFQANLKRQVQLVDEIRAQVTLKTTERSSALSRLQEAVQARIDTMIAEETESRRAARREARHGGGEAPEAAQLRQEAEQEAFETIDRELQEWRSQLTHEVTALQEATDKYTQALKEHLNRQTQITRLRLHIKENILYYMQAIWDHEPPDQRFFRLYNIEVPEIGEPTASMTLTLEPPRPSRSGRPFEEIFDAIPMAIPSGGRQAVTELPLPAGIPLTRKKLVEVADLDSLLGYKGNYMIFPLKQSNYLTTYMMQPYVDDFLGQLRDPDEFGNYTTDELKDLACCLYEKDPQAFTEEVRETFRRLLLERLTAPRREKDEIVVPTDSLYIEALPGKHPILEDFKLVHRAIDVKKVQAEVRHAELENVRLAARLLTGDHGDPDIEKKIIIEGDSTRPGVVVDTDT